MEQLIGLLLTCGMAMVVFVQLTSRPALIRLRVPAHCRVAPRSR